MRYKRPTRRARKARKGFTLVEVLIVMLILALLMTILMPVIGVVLLQVQFARSQLRVITLAGAVSIYKTENGTWYPGQVDSKKWKGKYTGSQVLAAHMFGFYDPENVSDPYENVKESNPEPATTPYMTYKEGMLMSGSTNSDTNNRLSDDYSTPRPIAYYPSGGGIGRAQFDFDCNSDFTSSASADLDAAEAKFEAFISDGNYSVNDDVPYNDGEFLLIGPGNDRAYFGEDDVHNWPK